MNHENGSNIQNTKSPEVQPVSVAHSTVDSDQDQHNPEVDAYSTLVKQLRSVRLLNDASKLLSRKEAAEEMIPIMEAEVSAASLKATSATESLEKLAFAQRAKEAEYKVTKLRDAIEAIKERAEVLAKELSS